MKMIKIQNLGNKISLQENNSEMVRHLQRNNKYSFLAQVKRLFKKDSITIINVNVLIINQINK